MGTWPHFAAGRGGGGWVVMGMCPGGLIEGGRGGMGVATLWVGGGGGVGMPWGCQWLD